MASTPSAPPPVAAPCCTTCTSQRTSTEFLARHVKTHITTSELICRICWQPFGSLNLRLGSTDDACQITGIRTCAHIFGSACLQNLVQTGTTCCPLCRTQWFTNPHGSPFESAALQRTLIRRTAARLQVEEAAARWFHYIHQRRVYFDPEASDSEDQMEIEIEPGRERGEEARGRETVSAQTRYITTRLAVSFESIVRTVKESRVQDLLTILQDTQPSPLDHRLYNRVTGQQELYAEHNPWGFRNWHQSDLSISTAVFRALQSVSGERIKEMLGNRLIGEKDGARSMRRERRRNLLADVEREWVAWYGDEGVRVFSRVLLHVLFYMRRHGLDWP